METWQILTLVIAVQVSIQIVAVTLLLRRPVEHRAVWLVVTIAGSLVGATLGLIMALRTPRAESSHVQRIDTSELEDLYARH